jgi:cysteine desulfurase
MTSAVYLDNAATTPLDARVLEAMLPHLGETRGNPSSLHAFGTSARKALEGARESLASLIGASGGEIVFTGGGTEADNLAVLGLARAALREDPGKRHAVITRVEHAAVREASKRLEAEGFEITEVGVDAGGIIDPEEFSGALRPGQTAFAAVVWANNEVGTVQPIRELSERCAERGIPLHTDAVQAAGRLDLDVGEAPVSTLALSAHKFYGPQGAGALYVREGTPIEPVLYGGGQERGLRSGTQNVAGAAGLGEAARLAREELPDRARHEAALRDRLLDGVLALPSVRLQGHREKRLPNNAYLTVEGVESEGLVLLLDALGYAVSNGSACASAGHKASPVLLAMGVGEREALSAIRVTVGKENTSKEIDGFVEAFATAASRLREVSPLYTG